MKITSTDKKVSIEISGATYTYPLNYLSYQKTDNGITFLFGVSTLITYNISNIKVNGTQATPENIDSLLDPLFKLGGGGDGVTEEELNTKLESYLSKQDGDGTLFLSNDDTYKIINQMPTGGSTGDFLYNNGLGNYIWQSPLTQANIDSGNSSSKTIKGSLLKANLDTKANAPSTGKGDLSQTDNSINVIFGTLTAVINRIDTTTITVSLSSSTNLDVNVTRRLTGPSVVDGSRNNYSLTSTPAIIDTITIGTYILVEYWASISGGLYYITGGGNSDLSESWVIITPFNTP